VNDWGHQERKWVRLSNTPQQQIMVYTDHPPHSSNQPHQRTPWGGFTLYLGQIWKYPINQPEECFGGSAVPYMHRISLGTDLRGKAEKRSNSELRTHYCMNDGEGEGVMVMAGEGR
jgi:hypothetical protein